MLLESNSSWIGTNFLIDCNARQKPPFGAGNLIAETGLGAPKSSVGVFCENRLLAALISLGISASSSMFSRFHA